MVVCTVNKYSFLLSRAFNTSSEMVYEFSKAFEKMTYFIQFDLNSGVFSVF